MTTFERQCDVSKTVFHVFTKKKIVLKVLNRKGSSILICIFAFGNGKKAYFRHSNMFKLKNSLTVNQVEKFINSKFYLTT